MKIGLVDSELKIKTGGGTSQQLDSQIKGLLDLGHEISLITLFPAADECPEQLPFKVMQENLSSNWFGRFLLKHKSKLGFLVLIKVLRKYESLVDVYYINKTWLVLGGALYRALGGRRPVAANLNGFYFCPNREMMDMSCWKECGLKQRIFHQKGSLFKRVMLSPFRTLKRGIEVSLVNRIDAFLPVTELMGEAYTKQGYDYRKMTAVSPAIDFKYLTRLRESTRHQSRNNGLYNILYLGRLSPEKGADILIKAVSRVDFPFQLHIVGNGPEEEDLKKLSSELGISEKVIFYGWMPHDKVFDFYLKSQLFVHPARWPELFCLTQLEAMALGIPMVVSDCGGLESYFQEIALTFKRASVDDLVDKINQAYGDPVLTADMVKQARRKAAEFDSQVAASKMLKVFSAVSNGREY
jgi:glycosyltransferase involved in cell wall biosynthesis